MGHILKVQPVLKEKIWGGTKLRDVYGYDIPSDHTGEAWVISGHKSGDCPIVEGEYKGKTVSWMFENHRELFGNVEGDQFPLLVKIIDAKQDLSVQVHPDNEYALRVEHEYGKTEMWYILDCEPDSFLYFGVNKEITKEEFERRIQDNTLLDVLKAVPVHKGDVFFIKSGTIHAIGAGIQICEIQQNSNTTYRVYDFGRVGKDGKPRELHIQKAIDVSNLSPIESDFKPCGPEEKNGDCDTVRLATCEYFTTFESTLNGTTTLHVDDESFGSILLIEGNATIENDGTTLEVNKGDSVFIDANSGDVKITGNCQWIYSRV